MSLSKNKFGFSKKSNIFLMFQIIIFIIILFLNGCQTITKKIISKEKFINKENSIFKSKKAKTKLIIKKDSKNNKLYGYLTSPFIHWANIIGEIEKNKNGFKFLISEFRILTNWPNGYTYGEYEASGIIDIEKKQSGYYAIKILEPFELWDLQKGEIKYFDDYYRFEEGLNKVKNRMDRIRTINKFIKENNFFEYYGRIYFKSSYSDSYKKTMRLFLFNKQTSFPKHLIKIKETGTLKRDFEEAIGLFFMDYNLDYYLNKILDNAEFIEE